MGNAKTQRIQAQREDNKKKKFLQVYYETHPYTNIDGKLKLEMEQIEITVYQLVIGQIVNFFDVDKVESYNMEASSDLLNSQRESLQASLALKIQNQYIIQYDLLIRSPVIVVPMALQELNPSKDSLRMSLGNINIRSPNNILNGSI